jgi:hypothetical protein
MTDATPVRWQPADAVLIPPTVSSATDLAPLAKQLNSREQKQLIQTFENGLFEIGTTFVWSRTMAGLKNRLAVLGIEFLAELLDRPDIRPPAQVHEVLTDYDAVRLAEDLGMLNGTQTLRLRHTLESISHFANRESGEDEEPMAPEEAMLALRTCVQTVLGHEQLDIAEGFASLRSQLERAPLADDGADVEGVIAAPYFYQRAVLRTLIAGVKTARGAQLENVLANVNILVPRLWGRFKDPDRFIVGRAYAELHADGQSKAASGLRSALSKVAGFDYVPENLRSGVFLEAAAKVQAAHFGWSNFHNEPAPMRALSSLGSSIPTPAFHRTMTAVLLVKVGNRYGTSFAAQEPADQMLLNVSSDRWRHFFDQCLPVDDVLLGELHDDTIAGRFCEVVGGLPRAIESAPQHPGARRMLQGAQSGDQIAVSRQARSMYNDLRR